jgi:hypothetical protein
MFTCLNLSYSLLSRAPSPICLGSVSLSPYKVARHKSPREPETVTNQQAVMKHSDVSWSSDAHSVLRED